jgi:hypothetical protein
MKNDMFDEQGRFAGNGVHVQVFDHSQELPAVEAITPEQEAIFVTWNRSRIESERNKRDGL